MQEIIVTVILVVVVLIIGWRIYKLFTRKPKDQSRCAGCDIDCALRNLNTKDCEKEKQE